jgi:trimeric autotransporter adhesin
MTRKYSSISVETTLASGISNTATSMTVATGTGSALMGGVTLAAGNVDQFTVALDVDTQNEEIVFVTAVTGDTLTVVRGRAGTSAISHTGGATVKHVLTSDDLTFYTTGVATADAAVAKSVVTAKADILVGASSGVVDNLPVGTNGQVLTADSAQTLGLSWTAAATGDVTLTGTQTLTNKTLTAPVINLSINANTATTYTFVLADNGKLVTSNNASAQTLSIPTNASVAYAIGAQINVAWITGAGQPTINAVTPGTTTILSTGATSTAPKLRAVNSVATCIKIATDTWLVTGDIA